MVTELFEELGSPARETVAALVSVLAVAGAVTVMAIVAVVPMAMGVVIEHKMLVPPPFAAQDNPEDCVTDTKATPAGKVSVNTLEVAGALSCPRF